VWAGKQAVWVADVGADTDVLRADVARQTGLKAGMAIPVLADGEVVAVLAFFVPVAQAPDERLLKLIGSVATHLGTVTRRKQAEEQLRRSQQRYETPVNSVEGIVWEADAPSLAFRFVSRQAERLLAYPAGRWLAEPTFWRDYIRPDDRKQALASRRRATQEKRDYHLTYRMMAANGKEVWLHDLVNVVVEAGQVVALRGVMVDITQQIRLEEQFRQVQKMEAVGRLAGGVAHDFNNLLTAILGYSQMLLMGLASGNDARELVEVIYKAGERAARLTRQFLAFSRKQVLKLSVLNLNTVVTGMQKMLGAVIGEDLDLVTRLEPRLGLVKADVGQLVQVIINLAVNARDAMPSGGRLTLETANEDLDETFAQEHADVQPGPYVRLSVSDTGCGMDQGTLARLFEPFFTTKEIGKGTGLGLATVYGIIKQTGGHIAVSSKPGRGTTFKFYLPRLAEPAPVAPEACRSPSPWPRGSETVLLVEDDKAVRDFSRALLEQAGYEVLEAPDGAEALWVSAGHPGRIDVLVTDVVMPGMSGRELADRLAASRPGVQVLYLSGYTEDAVIGRGVIESETTFLQKPFGLADIASKVREILDR
jgi:PAS domain S-box-containing protein